MANQNVLQLTQQTTSADRTSVFYAVTNGTTDTGLPFSVLVNNLGLTGIPTAPTAAAGTNSTQLATTAFVQASFTPLSGVLSLKQCGAYGDGVHDDTAAVNLWLSLVLAASGPKRGYVPAGTYVCSSQIVMDWGHVASTGAIFYGDGKSQSVFDLTSVSTAPAWLMTDTIGNKQAFYGTFIDIGIRGSVAGPVLQIGNETYTDAFNECKFDFAAWNSNTTTSACAVELNGLYNCDIFVVANCSGHGDALRLRSTQFSRIFGSCGNADTAIHLTNGYVYGNVFEAIDHEVVNTCVVIDSSNAVNNLWLGGQFVWNNGSGPAIAAINGTAGSNNRFIGPNIANAGTVAINSIGIIVYSAGNAVGLEQLGGLLLQPPSGDGALTINTGASNSDDIVLQEAGVTRWILQRDSSANLNLQRFNSSGTFVGQAFSLNNSTGVFTINNAAFTGTITPSTTAGIVGTTLADNANAGSVGEYVTATQSSAVSLASGVGSNITSISLTAGDWDVSGIINFVPANTTVVTNMTAGITTTSATLGVLGTFVGVSIPYTSTGGGSTFATPAVRINVSSTTTVYLVALQAFSASTMTATGFIRARRVR